MPTELNINQINTKLRLWLKPGDEPVSHQSNHTYCSLYEIDRNYDGSFVVTLSVSMAGEAPEAWKFLLANGAHRIADNSLFGRTPQEPRRRPITELLYPQAYFISEVEEIRELLAIVNGAVNTLNFPDIAGEVEMEDFEDGQDRDER